MSLVLAIAVWASCGLASGALLASVIRRGEPGTQRQQPAQIAITGVLFALLALRHGSELDLLPAVGYTAGAVPLAELDLRTGRLPNWLILLTHLLILIGLLVTTVTHLRIGALFAALAGALVFITLYGAWYVFLPGHLGGGDLKLSIATGAVLGWHGWHAAASPYLLTTALQLLSWLAGALLLIWLLQALVYIAARSTKGRRRDLLALRHGPFLVLGTIAALLLAP